MKIPNGILSDYIEDLNKTPFTQQKQMPNPTLATINKKSLIIFTAYLK